MLKLDQDWRLRADRMCWMLEQRLVSEETCREVWRIRGYYSFLEDGLRGACNQMMKPAKDVPDLLRRIDELHRTVRIACEGMQLKPEPEEMDFLD